MVEWYEDVEAGGSFEHTGCIGALVSPARLSVEYSCWDFNYSEIAVSNGRFPLQALRYMLKDCGTTVLLWRFHDGYRTHDCSLKLAASLS